MRKKTRITRRDIIEYRKHIKTDWHDRQWWDYHITDKCMAIGIAIDVLGRGADYADISAEAEKLL